MLHINDMSFAFGGKNIFEDCTLHIAPRQKVGLVGKNGAGKSTLLKLILGELQTDKGDISCRQNSRIGHVKQEITNLEQSVINAVLEADTERHNLLNELEVVKDGIRSAEIHERLLAIDAYSAEARASTILSGLGFDINAQQRSLKEFSGGWQMRVCLAATLFSNPELLLLDEPTNHLDLEACIWLEGYLQDFDGTLIIISHEKDILNKSVNRIVHIENKKLIAYGGNYDSFEKNRRIKMELQAKNISKQLEQRRHIMDFVERFRYKASKAKQAQSRVKMLEKMEAIIPIVEEKSISFDFPPPEPLSPPIIHMEKVSVGYGDKIILKNLNLSIEMDDRITLLGANGNGKSTFAKLLAGKLNKMDGEMRRSQKLRIGYFSQHQEEELDYAGTPFSNLEKLMPMATPTAIRSHLGAFGFSGDMAEMEVRKLSGGEKARLLFSIVCHQKPHILILDEPTNHLDIDTREALTGAINAFEGAVILITHDSHLIEMTADRLWLVENGTCKAYDDDIETYKKYIKDKNKTDKSTSKNSNDAKSNDKKEERRLSAQKRERLAPLKKQVTNAEKQIEKLNKEKDKLEEEMGNPDLYNEANSQKLVTLQIKLGEITNKLEEEELNWLSYSEEYELAMQSDEA